MLEAVRPLVQGVQVSAPFGRYNVAAEVIASKANSRTTLIESAIKFSAQPSRPSHDSILAQRPAAEKSAKRSDRIAHRVIALFKYDGANRRSSL